MIPTPGVTEVYVTNLEFSYKSKKKFCVLSLYSHIIRPYDKFYYVPTERLSGYSHKESVRLSVHPLKHYSFILYFCLTVKVFTLKFIRPIMYGSVLVPGEKNM